MNNGKRNKVKVSLRIFGEDLVPDTISSQLNCMPTEARLKGDVKVCGKKKIVFEDGSWRLHSKTDNVDLENQIISVLSQVTDDLKVWEKLTKQFKVDIFCGIFFSDINGGFGLSSRVSEMLSKRNLEIGFDLYFLDEN